MNKEKELRNILKNAGYSITQPRRDIFRYLLNKKPISMHDLVWALKDKTDRASVYRTIQLFEELNIVHRINIGWKYKIELSDTFHYHHHHITCEGCEKIISVKDDALEDRIRFIAQKEGVIMTGHQIEIQGWCANCAKRFKSQ